MFCLGLLVPAAGAHAQAPAPPAAPTVPAVPAGPLTLEHILDLAESRSVETVPGHYDYFISVTWDRLYDFANSAGIDLPSSLADAATIPSG